ncbi:MAG: Gfo/Idh/MocA family protein [Bosea sp. (in: a-proteobacteria)]
MTIVPVRVAAVGTGYFSRFQYRAWSRIPEVALVGVCNRTMASAQAFAEEFGIPFFTDDLDQMLVQAKPDLLDIITPPETHLAAIRLAAARKIDVICQKPFCQTLGEAKEAVRIADEAGIQIIVHENFRFQPWHREIKRLLERGKLGQVYQATFRLRPGDGQGPRAYLDRQPYFQNMPRLLVHETAIHLIDTFRFLFGDVEAVFASLRKLNPVIAGEDAGLIMLDMANGVRCLFDGNRLSDHQAGNRRLTMGEMLIEGEKGVLSLDGDGSISFRPHGSNEVQDMPYQWHNVDFGGDCVHELQQHVIDHRLGRRPVENTGREYLTNILIEEAVYASDAEQRRLSI